MSTPTVEILRQQLREKFPGACVAWQGRQGELAAALEAGEPLVPLGVGEAPTPFGIGGTSDCPDHRDDGPPVLDFPAGTLTEVVGAGAGWIIAALLESVSEEPGASEMVLVDGADGFDPASFSARVCARLLWVRCRKSAMEMIKAADWVVRDGNVPLVLVDATGLARRELAKVPTAAWWRLKQSTQRTGCRLVVAAQTELVPSAGRRWRISMELELVDFAASREELLGRLQLIPQRVRQVN